MSEDRGSPDLARSVEVLRRAQAGEEGAQHELFARYYPRILSLVRARLGPGLRRHAESMDVVQETMGQLLRDLPRYEPRSERALIDWLARLVENRIRDLAKFHRAERCDGGRERRIAGPASTVGDRGAPEPSTGAGTPSEDASKREERALLADGLGQLEPDQRRVLELRGAGASWSEVARELGLSDRFAAHAAYTKAMTALARGVAGRPPRSP